MADENAVDMESGDQESDVKDDRTLYQNEEKTEKLVQLPIARIRNIMKMDQEVHIASQEAVFLITKATVSLKIKIGIRCYSFLV